MTNDQNSDDNDIFRQTMDALGVEKTPGTTRQKIKAPQKTALKSKTTANTPWPTILYKDIGPEEHANNTELSAQLTANSILFHRGGLTQKHLKRLQRGQYKIASQIDLHGFTVDEAIQALNQYINYYDVTSHTCCLIIHGKGYHSKQGTAKLKSITERWLKAHPRIIAFSSAQAKDGGTGAVYVLLKHSP